MTLLTLFVKARGITLVPGGATKVLRADTFRGHRKELLVVDFANQDTVRKGLTIPEKFELKTFSDPKEAPPSETSSVDITPRPELGGVIDGVSKEIINVAFEEFLPYKVEPARLLDKSKLEFITPTPNQNIYKGAFIPKVGEIGGGGVAPPPVVYPKSTVYPVAYPKREVGAPAPDPPALIRGFENSSRGNLLGDRPPYPAPPKSVIEPPEPSPYPPGIGPDGYPIPYPEPKPAPRTYPPGIGPDGYPIPYPETPPKPYPILYPQYPVQYPVTLPKPEQPPPTIAPPAPKPYPQRVGPTAAPPTYPVPYPEPKPEPAPVPYPEPKPEPKPEPAPTWYPLPEWLPNIPPVPIPQPPPPPGPEPEPQPEPEPPPPVYDTWRDDQDPPPALRRIATQGLTHVRGGYNAAEGYLRSNLLGTFNASMFMVNQRPTFVVGAMGEDHYPANSTIVVTNGDGDLIDEYPVPGAENHKDRVYSMRNSQPFIFNANIPVILEGDQATCNHLATYGDPLVIVTWLGGDTGPYRGPGSPYWND